MRDIINYLVDKVADKNREIDFLNKTIKNTMIQDDTINSFKKKIKGLFNLNTELIADNEKHKTRIDLLLNQRDHNEKLMERQRDLNAEKLDKIKDIMVNSPHMTYGEKFERTIRII